MPFVVSLTTAKTAVPARAHPTCPGYFFNGRQYVCFDGDKSEWHPLIDELVEAWLATVNAAAAAAAASAPASVADVVLAAWSTSAPAWADPAEVLAAALPPPSTPSRFGRRLSSAAAADEPAGDEPATPTTPGEGPKPRRFLPKPPTPKPKASY